MLSVPHLNTQLSYQCISFGMKTEYNFSCTLYFFFIYDLPPPQINIHLGVFYKPREKLSSMELLRE